MYFDLRLVRCTISFTFITARPRASLKIENHTPDPAVPSQHHKTYILSVTMSSGLSCVEKRVDTCKNETCGLNLSFFDLENTSLEIDLREPQNRLRFINIIVEGYYINNIRWTKYGAILRVKICSGSEMGYIFG